jgi:hypothetical protein
VTTELSAVISKLNLLERDRRSFIAGRCAIENMARARILSCLGHDPGIKGAATKEMKNRAKRLLEVIKDHQSIAPEDAPVIDATRTFVEPLLFSVKIAEREEAACVKEMERLARSLPSEVIAVVERTRGFGIRGLAVIAAICHGDNMRGLGDFATRDKVWRKMGLSAAPGQGCESLPHERRVFDSNRAQAFAFIYDPVVRAQVRRARNESGALIEGGTPIAIGDMGAVYLRKKAEYMARVNATMTLPRDHPDKWTLKRADMAARRYMAKGLLDHLWRAWRGAASNPATLVADQNECR